MIKKGEIYQVEDASGRAWGVVTIKVVEGSTAHGYLTPTNEFEKIKPIFEQHGNFLSSEGGLESSKTVNNIVNLGTKLISEDRQKKCKPKAIFVNENLLLSFNVE